MSSIIHNRLPDRATTPWLTGIPPEVWTMIGQHVSSTFDDLSGLELQSISTLRIPIPSNLPMRIRSESVIYSDQLEHLY
jgi:hypothetical protein